MSFWQIYVNENIRWLESSNSKAFRKETKKLSKWKKDRIDKERQILQKF